MCLRRWVWRCALCRGIYEISWTISIDLRVHDAYAYCRRRRLCWRCGMAVKASVCCLCLDEVSRASLHYCSFSVLIQISFRFSLNITQKLLLSSTTTAIKSHSKAQWCPSKWHQILMVYVLSHIPTESPIKSRRFRSTCAPPSNPHEPTYRKIPSPTQDGTSGSTV